MKKTTWLAVCLLMAITVQAQTQQGIVKTRGRMVNGVLQPGQGLQGATVQVKDRSAVVSGTHGKFSFPLRTNTYLVQSVKKHGYQLVDMEACRSYQYSKDTLYLVMETPEQQQSDLLAKERTLRRNLQQKLNQREEEVDALNVSLEEKNRLLQEINQQREENEKIIKDLAKYYATLDYDQLDDFQRRVSDCLENGELEKADSLLRSRGDMHTRIEAVKAEQQAEAKEESELAQRQKDLEASKAGTNKRIEEIAADCYSFHQRFAQDHQRDSAAYYLELRASLDTTNVEWAIQAGRYIDNYLADYTKACEYYQCSLRQSMQKHGKINEETAESYSNIGLIYGKKGDFLTALDYHNKCIAIRINLYGTNHRAVASSYNNIATVYSDLADYDKALEFLFKAIAINKNAIDSVHAEVAYSYNNIGMVYERMGNMGKAMEYYNKALTIWKKVYGEDHIDVATVYANIGQCYGEQHNYEKAMENGLKALEIRKKY